VDGAPVEFCFSEEGTQWPRWSAEMLQALGCHLAVMVLYIVLSLEVLSLSAFVVLSATL